MHPFTGFAIIGAIVALLVRWANATDIPRIKNLPELPGVPVFGSLFLLGKHHARTCARLAKDYGEVFQVRLGNRVSFASLPIVLAS
jgi:phenylacetate 2-hydroxylase